MQQDRPALPLGYLARIGEANWLQLWDQAALFASLIAVTLIGLILNSSRLEAALRRDGDLDGELKAAGIASLVAGLGAGLIGYQRDIGEPRDLGSNGDGRRLLGRLAALGAALVCLFALILGGWIFAYLPKMVLATALSYLGGELIWSWVIEARKRLSEADYSIVVLIFLTAVLVGFLEAMAVAVVAGAILLSLNRSRVTIVKNAISGAERHSNLDRADSLQQILRDQGYRIHIVQLQGFLYLGTAQSLIDGVWDRLEAGEHRPLDFVVLDASHINGMDSSFAISFKKLARLAENELFEVCLTNLPAALFEILRREGIEEERRQVARPNVADGPNSGRPPPQPDPAEARVRIFRDLDHALEWCENEIIFASGQTIEAREEPLEDQLRRVFPTLSHVSEFMAYVVKVSFAEGEILIRQGDESSDIFFIESGEVGIEIEPVLGQTVVLRQMGPGTAIGEAAFYLGKRRSASVKALAPTTAYKLSRHALDEMAEAHPAAAVAFHEFMNRHLAERLRDSNNLIAALTV